MNKARRASRDDESVHRQVTVDDVLRPAHQRDLRRLPRLVREAFSLVRQASGRQLILAGGLQLLAGLSLAAQLLVMRRVLDGVTGTGALDVVQLAPDLVAFALLLIVVALATLAQREQQAILADLVEKYTTGHVLAVSTSVDLIQYDNPDFFDRLQRARVNASVRPLQIANGVIGLMGGVAAVGAVGAALLFLEPLVLVLIVVGGIPTLFLNRLSSQVMHAFAVRQTAADRRRGYLYLALSRKEEAHELRAFDSSDHLRSEHDQLYDRRLVDLRRTLRRRFYYGAGSATLTTLVTVGALVMLLWFVQIGRLDISSAAVAVGAVIIVAGRIRALIASTGSLYEGALFLADFTDFVAANARREAELDIATEPLEPFGAITLDRVGFTYPSRSEPSLHDVSLTIRHGEVIALVGENGSGKTTLTKLLAGLYRPTEGRLEWDGIDTVEHPLAELRRHVTVIFQDFARYFLSAHENVAISRIENLADHDGVRRATDRAGAGEFLRNLPSGFDTLLGPSFVGGSDLSTGQWQRVALARAYFRDAPMLILDEPTAALDPRGEYEIFQQVRRLAEGHTVVLVSHRFSSVRAADRIIVLDQGRIVEEGSHEQLMHADGLYAELFSIQAAGYQPKVRSAGPGES